MTYEDIRYEIDEDTAWITLNRPDVLNAVRWQSGRELSEAVRSAEEDDRVRFVVLTGEGRAFCAGDDIKQVFGAGDFGERYGELRLNQLRKTYVAELESLMTCEKPTIAAVNGVALGTGMDLAVACDLRIASDTARFGYFFVRRGLVGTGPAAYLLPRIVGMSRAYDIFLTGRMIEATEAEHLGLVNQVVPADRLRDAVVAYIRELRPAAPLAQRAMKRLMRKGLTLDWETMDQIAMPMNDILFQSKDHQEGIAAYLEKRPPQFQGR